MKKPVIALLATLLMTSCTASGKDGYVNEEEVKDKFENSVIKPNDDIIETDEKAKVFLMTNYSVSSDQLMIFEPGNKKTIELSTGMISSFCNIPGCSHDDNAMDTCIEYKPLNNPVLTKEGMYYTNYFEPDKLHYSSAGEDKTVFENTFYTDKEKELEPDAKTGFGIFIRGETMYVTGMTYFYTVDISTMKQTCEPVIISESPIWNADVYGDMFYVTNENLELISYNMKSGEKRKLSDKVWRIQACEDGLFYIKTDGDVNSIYRSSADGSGETKLVSDTQLSMYVTEEHIYYLSEDGLNVCDRTGGNTKNIRTELTYENGEEYVPSVHGQAQLISCPSSKYIYLLDYTKSTGEKCYNALFKIDKQSGEYTAISLGIWYQPNGGKEEIISY